MFFNKKKSKTKFINAKTPEARQRQRAAIISYYIKKNNEKK